MIFVKFREPPNLLRLEVTEETTTRIAKTVRAWIKEAIRWLFLVGAEKEWPVFVGAVAALLLLSYIGSCMDLLTLVYAPLGGAELQRFEHSPNFTLNSDDDGDDHTPEDDNVGNKKVVVVEHAVNGNGVLPHTTE